MAENPNDSDALLRQIAALLGGGGGGGGVAEKAGGFLGFLGSPQGALISQFGGSLLKGIAGLLGGGARRRRVRDLEGFAGKLEGQFKGEADLHRRADVREKALLPAANRFFANAASRVGAGSGLAFNIAGQQTGELRNQGLLQDQSNIDSFNLNLTNQIASIKKLLAQLQ